MAKITDQNIPPELANLYARLVSPMKAAAPPTRKIRTRRAVKRPKPIRKMSATVKNFYRAATAAGIKSGLKADTKELTDFAYSQAKLLMVGVFNPKIWEEITTIAQTTLEEAPTSTENLTPGAYAYRDTANRPTTPTYTGGAPTAAAKGYTGSTSGQLFRDTSYRWRRLTFDAVDIQGNQDTTPVILLWDTQIGIAANRRGSRPMLSLVFQAYKSGADGTKSTDLTPPLLKKTTFYWRFKIPPTVAPFYNATITRKISMVINGLLKKDGTGATTTITTKSGNRPMMGKGYNNNTQVDTAHNNDPRLFAIAPCLGASKQIATKYDTTRYQIVDLDTQTLTLYTVGAATDLCSSNGVLICLRDTNRLLYVAKKEATTLTPVMYQGAQVQLFTPPTPHGTGFLIYVSYISFLTVNYLYFGADGKATAITITGPLGWYVDAKNYQFRKAQERGWQIQPAGITYIYTLNLLSKKVLRITITNGLTAGIGSCSTGLLYSNSTGTYLIPYNTLDAGLTTATRISTNGTNGGYAVLFGDVIYAVFQTGGYGKMDLNGNFTALPAPSPFNTWTPWAICGEDH